MKKAFTLIELLLYVSLMVVILNVGIYFVWQIIGSKTKNMVYLEVEKNLMFSLEKISYEAKRAKSLAPFSSARSSSEITLIKPNNLTVRFYLIDGVLWMDDSGPLPLTSQRVKITQLSFLNLEPAVPGAFQVKIKISYNNPDQRKEYQAEIATQKTISLRDNNE